MSIIDPIYEIGGGATDHLLEGMGELDVLLSGGPAAIGEIPTVVADVLSTLPTTIVPTVAGLVAQASGALEALDVVDELVVGLPDSLGPVVGGVLGVVDTLRTEVLGGLASGVGDLIADDGPVLDIVNGVLDQISGASTGLPIQFENLSDLTILGSQTITGNVTDMALSGFDALVGSESALTGSLISTLDPVLTDSLGPYGGALVDGLQALGSDTPVAVQGVVEDTLGSADTLLTTSTDNVGSFVTTTGDSVNHFGETLNSALATAPSDPLTAVGMIVGEAQGTTIPTLTGELQTDVDGIGTGAEDAVGDLQLNATDFLDHMGGSVGGVVGDLGLM